MALKRCKKGFTRSDEKCKKIVFTGTIAKEFTPPHIDIFMKDGIKMLKKPHKEDSKFYKMRVVSKRHKVWIIEDPQAITLLKPEDY